MKKQTIVKIAFCVLLIAALVYGAADLHPGRSRLHAQFAEVRNGHFEVEPYIDGKETYAQRLKITLVNDNDFAVTVLGLRAEKSDDSLLRLDCTPERIVTIPAHTSEPQNIWFHIVSLDHDNEESLDLLRKHFSVRIVYADASSLVASPDGADERVLRTEWVR